MRRTNARRACRRGQPPRRGFLGRRRRIQEDPFGQMMLLTAVLLIIGFVALAGIVARVSTVGSQTAAVRDNAVAQEAPQVAQVVDQVILGLKDNATTKTGVVKDNTGSFRTNVSASMAHLALLERSRGFRLSFDPQTCLAADPGHAYVEVTLHDRTTRVTFLSSAWYNNTAAC